jgi:glycosyltransferase involved in cell wall biosynthesis
MHDMNSFTGGCHYSMGCEQYNTNCAQCLQIADSKTATHFLDVKIKAFKKNKHINFVGPSTWLSNLSKNSNVAKDFPHYDIRNAFDTKIFKPLNKQACKEILGFPKDKKLITYITPNIDNKRKGFDFLIQVVKQFELNSNVHFCCVGNTSENLGVQNFGHVNDEILMAQIYNATDLFLMPSLADNLPNVLIESILCGTPALSFKVGGIPEIIQHGINGILCNVSAKELIDEINNFLNQKYSFDAQEIASQAAAEYDDLKIALQYKMLYQSILK